MDVARREQFEEKLKDADVGQLQELAAVFEEGQLVGDLWLLSLTHYFLFFRTLTDADLNLAIDTAYKVLSHEKRDGEMVHQVSAKCGDLFMERFEKTKSHEDVAVALYWLQYSINTMPDDLQRRELLLTRHNSLIKNLKSHGSILGCVDEGRPEPSDLGFAHLHIDQHPHKIAKDAQDGIFWITHSYGKAWLSFAYAIKKGCGAQGYQNVDDITLCIRYLDEAFARFQETEAKVDCLDNSSMMFNLRYEVSNDIDDVRRAVSAAERILEILPRNEDKNLAQHLHNLAIKLRTLHVATREKQHLDRAVPLAEDAAAMLPPNSPKVLKYETECAACLSLMYLCVGDTDTLTKGIARCDKVATLAKEKGPYAQEYWNVLTGLVRFRYERMQVREDIYRAVVAAREAVEQTPPKHNNLTTRVHNLAAVLWLRFDRDGNPEDLDEAIQCATKAEAESHDRSHFMPTILSTLSGLFVLRYQHRLNADDLEKAVYFGRKSVDLSRPEKLEYLANRNNLARIILIRSVISESRAQRMWPSSLSDVSEAVGLFKTVVDGTPPTDGRLPSRHRNLGNAYFERYKITRSVEDVEKSVALLRQCTDNSLAAPSLRIEAAKKAADILILDSRFTEADKLLQHAVALLQQVSPRSLQQKDQQDVISKFSGMTTLATSTALQAGATAGKALEILEEGRGIILGLLFDIRSDISALRSQHPTLATQFEQLRDSLDSPAAQDNVGVASSNTTMTLDFTHRSSIVKQLDESIAHIREQEGFRNFLAPPSIADMQAIASAGPIIVINVSEYRSDAFIVTSSQLEHTPLPDLQLDKVKQWATLLMSRKITQPQMFEVLGWLWDVLVKRVLESLHRLGVVSNQLSNKPRVWWIPSGPLCSLPIHAAGKYTQNSSSILMDQVISSYSPSIKAMLFSRRNADNTTSNLSLHRPLVVSMGTTPGASDLTFAVREGQAVRNELSRLPTTEQVPAVRLKPSKAAVMADMSHATILHFAGHGLSDPKDPLQSKLLVEDWQQDPLTVKDLLSLKLHQKPPFIAYLSACSTGRSSVDQLLDEGLHLMSACLLAGFQHVVGSLWEVSDQHSAEVARRVFATMVDADFSHDSVSSGLQESLQSLRESKHFHSFRDGFGASQQRPGQQWHGGDPRIWAAYIHMGF